MKTKTVLRSLFLAYGLTGVCLLLLAFLAFQFDLGLDVYKRQGFERI